MATKKTSRSPKSAPPAPPAAAEVKTVKAARKAPAKAPPAAKAGRVAAPRKRPAAAPAVTESAPPVMVTDEHIRVRAYFLALEYPGSNRDDVDFWLLAERELRPEKE